MTRTNDYVAVLACGFIFAMTAVVTSNGVYDHAIPDHPNSLILEKLASELSPRDAALLERWAVRSSPPYPGAGADGILTVREALDDQASFERHAVVLSRPRTAHRP